MAKEREIEPIRRELSVAKPVKEAFTGFVEGISKWWPSDYTWSQDGLEEIGIEARVDGRCFEIGPHDFHCDWGRVLHLEPPHRIVFTWQINPDRVPEPNPQKASVVEVLFTLEGSARTKVELKNHGFGNHGEGGLAYRAGMAASEGWSYILERYARFLDED